MIKGKFIRIKGIVTIYSVNKHNGEQWYGGSQWTVKNPLIRFGRCKHKPIKKEIWYHVNFDGKRTKHYFKGRMICLDCGDVLRVGRKVN